MYTCCPQCSTSFRVGPAQLQVANGKVRCGQCHNVFSALAYLREGAEEPSAVHHPEAAPEPLPQIIAQPVTTAEEVNREGGYEEDLVNTDQWEIIAEPSSAEQPSAEFDAQPHDVDVDDDAALDAAIEGIEEAEAHLEEHGGANNKLPDAAIGGAAEESLLNAQLELSGSQANEIPDPAPLFEGTVEGTLLEAELEPNSSVDEQSAVVDGGPEQEPLPALQLEPGGSDELPDATFGILEEEEDDALPDPQFADAIAAELAIEEALQAAMTREEGQPDEAAETQEPEIEITAEPSDAGFTEALADEAAESAENDHVPAEARDEFVEQAETAREEDESEPPESAAEDHEQQASEVIEEAAGELSGEVATDDEWELGLLEAYAREVDEPPPTPAAPEPAAKDPLLDQDLADDDLDEFLFDDEHGIQEYLEQHNADSVGAQETTAEVPGASPAAEHAESAIIEPEGSASEPAAEQVEEAIPEPVVEQVSAAAAHAVALEPVREDDAKAEPGEVEDLSVFADFDQAAETALEFKRDVPPAPAAAPAATPDPPQPGIQPQQSHPPDIDPAHSRAMIAQELSLLDRSAAETDDTGAPNAAAADDDLLILVDDKGPAESEPRNELPGEVEIDLKSSQAANHMPDSGALEADDDPLDRPGSEEYTFPLYFEQEKATRVLADAHDEEDTPSGETELLVGQAADDADATLMMRLPLGDSVEFEVPIEDEGDETQLLDDSEEEELFFKGQEEPELWPDLPTAKAARKVSWRHRGRRLMWSTLSVLLVLALATQLVHYNRESLVIRPTIGPWLQNVYASLGLKLAPPGDLDQYEIRLHVAPAIQGKIQISATLANLADHVQPYPLVRLVLEDRWQEAVGNLIVEPRDYLARAATGELMAPKQRVEAQIEVVDPGPTAESYKLDVCLRHSQGTLRCADDS